MTPPSAGLARKWRDVEQAEPQVCSVNTRKPRKPRPYRGRADLVGVCREWVVGDPGIEPGMGLPGGVTVRCRTLQLVARCISGHRPEREPVDTGAPSARQPQMRSGLFAVPLMWQGRISAGERR